MTVGEFYRRLVAHGPELIGRAQYYQAVKATITEAEKDLRTYRIYKPRYRLEKLEEQLDKWFGSVAPKGVKVHGKDGPYKRRKDGKLIFQKERILESEPSKPPCFGESFTQPECRQCWYLQGCTEKLPDCVGTPFPTDVSIAECQLCPHLDACCKKAVGLEVNP